MLGQSAADSVPEVDNSVVVAAAVVVVEASAVSVVAPVLSAVAAVVLFSVAVSAAQSPAAGQSGEPALLVCQLPQPPSTTIITDSGSYFFTSSYLVFILVLLF